MEDEKKAQKGTDHIDADGTEAKPNVRLRPDGKPYRRPDLADAGFVPRPVNWTREERIENGRKGAAVTNEKKRKKRMYRDMADAILRTKAPSKMKAKAKAVLGDDAEEVVTLFEVIVGRLAVKAIKGDVSAAKELIALSGRIDDGSNASRDNGPVDDLSAALRDLAHTMDQQAQRD